jgi:hypothetical protein
VHVHPLLLETKPMRQSIPGRGSGNALWLALVLLTMAAVATPAQHSTACRAREHRQFDFWIGEWDVTNSRGQRIGASLVERVPGGCALSETWTGANGLRGQGISAWDSTANTWHHSWTDNEGTTLNLSGGIVNGAMVMEGERRLPDGTTTLERITWTPNADGSIRQLWETSRDRGMRRTNVFDAVYRKRR